MAKKECLIIILSLVLISIFAIDVSADSCEVKSVSDCNNDGWHIIFKMSDPINSHVELESESNYDSDYALCCDFPNPSDTPYRTCDSRVGGDNGKNNTVIRLSSTTNAHAEKPYGTTSAYDTRVCYQNLICSMQSEPCPGKTIGMYSLSAETNAHVSKFDEYDIKVCCGQNTAPPTLDPGVHWADSEGYPIEEQIQVDLEEGETVYMTLIGGPANTDVTFKIYENDSNEGFLGFGSDDNIEPDKIVTTTDTGYAQTSFNIQSGNLGEDEDEDPLRFYFEVAGEFSDDLNVKITECGLIGGCSDYSTEEDCESDTCDVGKLIADNDDCGEITEKEIGGKTCDVKTTCECSWDSSSSECKSEITETIISCEGGPGPGFGVEVGSCIYDTTSSGDCSNNEILEYSWTADFKWGENNEFDYNEITDNGWDEDDFYDDTTASGYWRYDPLNQREGCEGGSRTVPCPASIQLPFFSASTLVAALIVLALIYYFVSKNNLLEDNNKSKKSSSKKSKKKSSKKKTSSKKSSKKSNKKK